MVIRWRLTRMDKSTSALLRHTATTASNQTICSVSLQQKEAPILMELGQVDCLLGASRCSLALALNKSCQMCSYLKDQELSNFKTSTQESFSVWSSLIRYSLLGLLDLTKVGVKTRCKLLMTTAIQLRTLLLAPTLSTFSSRKALHGPNQYLSAMIEVFVSIECFSAS